MSQEVNRKKSYRWASASQTTYDGADWDSSDEEKDMVLPDIDIEEVRKEEHLPDKLNLPILPKLVYAEENTDDHKTNNVPIIGENQHIENTHKDIEKQEETHDNGQIDDDEEDIYIANSFSNDDMKSSSELLKSPGVDHSRSFRRSQPNKAVNDDLDNLMEQISKEMTPKLPAKEVFVPVLQQDEQKEDSQMSEEETHGVAITGGVSQSKLESNEENQLSRDNSFNDDPEFTVSKAGYFANMVESDDPNSEDNEEARKEEDIEKTSIVSNNTDTHSIKIGQSTSTVQLEHKSVPSSEQIFSTPNPSYILDSVNNDDLPTKTTVVGNESEEKMAHDVTTVALQPDEENIQDEESEKSSFFDEYNKSDSDVDEGEKKKPLSDSNSEDNFPKLRYTSKTDLSYMSSSDNEDALSFTNSIGYEDGDDHKSETKEDDEDEGFKFADKKVRQSIIESSDDDINSVDDDINSVDDDINSVDDDKLNNDVNSDENLNMAVSKSGYFNKMVEENESIKKDMENNEEEEDSGEKNATKDKEVDDDVFSIPSTISSNAASISTLDKETIGKNGIDDDGTDGEPKSVDGDDSEQLSLSGDDDDEDMIKNADDMLAKSRQSVNLGKWKPDTDALRSGFVQENIKKAPPGFVIDENGNFIDLTPSSMKEKRIVSTYSEMESGWNAFPSEENANDLETIRDTKTLYDNSTIYNVPGLVGRNESLPPLPSGIEDVAKRNISDGTVTSVERKSSFQGDLVGIHQPNSQEMAKLNGSHVIPEVNVNKLIGSNISNASKLDKLRAYYTELDSFDTGIQTWICYSLKSSDKENKDFLFDEYKNNRHVREAYANAEDLTRRNTVINTVATVNQNVSHLRKIVFSHTMKPKVLFSSIGKKKL